MNAGKFERQRVKIESRKGRSGNWRKRAMHHLVEDAHAEPIKSGNRVVAYQLEDGAACTKRRFQTEEIANDTIRQIADEPEPRKKPIRAYFCWACSGWHLTSKEKRV